ncbi:MAG: response regulator [Thermoguttaceae bacterium]
MAKIVVIANSPETAQRSARYLNEEGYDASTTTSGVLAMEVLAAESPDLVLLDLALPDHQALDLCRRLKSDPQLCEIAVVLGGAVSQSDDVRQGMADGADDYLIGPSSKELLLARVRSVLRARTDRDTIARMNRHLEARIAAHKATEEAAAAMEQYVRLFVAVVGARLHVVDADSNLRYVDPHLRSALGDYHGKTCDGYFPGGYAARERSPAAEALRTLRTVVTEQVSSGETGLPWRVTSIPFQNERGEWLVAQIHVAPGSGVGD